MQDVKTQKSRSKELNTEVTIGVVTLLLEHCSHILNQGLLDEAAIVFKHSITVLSSIEIASSQNNRINDIGIRLIEMGQWRIIGSAIINSFGDPLRSNTPYSIKFLKATCLKKQGQLEKAQVLYNEIIASGERIGDWVYVVRYHAAHTTQLRGDFTSAKSAYQHILKKTKNQPRFARRMACTLAQKQMVVNQIVSGQFSQALDDLKEVDYFWGVLEQIELKRVEGHIYRFNFMFRKAEGLYKEALQLSKKHGINSMTVKLMINLAQTLCWQEPHKAIEYADEALSLSRWVDSATEKGKAIGAKSIALSLLNEHYKALDMAEKSIRIQTEKDYQPGIVLGLQAKTYAHLLCGNMNDFYASLAEMQSKVDEFDGAYGFLMTPFTRSQDSLETSRRACGKKAYQWLDLEFTLKEWRSIAASNR